MTSVFRPLDVRALWAALALLWFCFPLLAADNQPAGEELLDPVARGLAITEEADRRDSGFNDSQADLVMILTLSPEEIIQREMRQMILEVDDDGDKSIMVFDRPRDLKGTAILTFTHKFESDDQWLYLPALKRVKRLSSADKSGPFMGSEFAVEDLASNEVEKYTYTYLGEEVIEGVPCFVIERVPVDPKSGYKRQVTWVDQEIYVLRQIDYYDRKNELLKTKYLLHYELYLEHYWRPAVMIMDNHQTGKSTTLEFRNFQFRTGLTDKDFSRGALSRIR